MMDYDKTSSPSPATTPVPCRPPPPGDAFWGWVELFFLVLLLVVGAFGNALVVRIYRTTRNHNVHVYFVFVLGVIDFFVSTFREYSFWAAAPKGMMSCSARGDFIISMYVLPSSFGRNSPR